MANPQPTAPNILLDKQHSIAPGSKFLRGDSALVDPRFHGGELLREDGKEFYSELRQGMGYRGFEIALLGGSGEVSKTALFMTGQFDQAALEREMWKTESRESFEFVDRSRFNGNEVIYEYSVRGRKTAPDQEPDRGSSMCMASVIYRDVFQIFWGGYEDVFGFDLSGELCNAVSRCKQLIDLRFPASQEPSSNVGASTASPRQENRNHGDPGTSSQTARQQPIGNTAPLSTPQTDSEPIVAELIGAEPVTAQQLAPKPRKEDAPATPPKSQSEPIVAEIISSEPAASSPPRPNERHWVPAQAAVPLDPQVPVPQVGSLRTDTSNGSSAPATAEPGSTSPLLAQPLRAGASVTPASVQPTGSGLPQSGSNLPGGDRGPASDQEHKGEENKRLRDNLFALGQQLINGAANPNRQQFYNKFLNRHSSDPESLRNAIKAVHTQMSAAGEQAASDAEWMGAFQGIGQDVQDWTLRINRAAARFVPGGDKVVAVQQNLYNIIQGYDRAGFSGAIGNGVVAALDPYTAGLATPLYHAAGDPVRALQERARLFNPGEYVRELHEVAITAKQGSLTDAIGRTVDLVENVGDATRDAQHLAGRFTGNAQPKLSGREGEAGIEGSSAANRHPPIEPSEHRRTNASEAPADKPESLHRAGVESTPNTPAKSPALVAEEALVNRRENSSADSKTPADKLAGELTNRANTKSPTVHTNAEVIEATIAPSHENARPVQSDSRANLDVPHQELVAAAEGWQKDLEQRIFVNAKDELAISRLIKKNAVGTPQRETLQNELNAVRADNNETKRKFGEAMMRNYLQTRPELTSVYDHSKSTVANNGGPGGHGFDGVYAEKHPVTGEALRYVVGEAKYNRSELKEFWKDAQGNPTDAERYFQGSKEWTLDVIKRMKAGSDHDKAVAKDLEAAMKVPGKVQFMEYRVLRRDPVTNNWKVKVSYGNVEPGAVTPGPSNTHRFEHQVPGPPPGTPSSRKNEVDNKDWQTP